MIAGDGDKVLQSISAAQRPEMKSQQSGATQ